MEDTESINGTETIFSPRKSGEIVRVVEARLQLPDQMEYFNQQAANIIIEENRPPLKSFDITKAAMANYLTTAEYLVALAKSNTVFAQPLSEAVLYNIAKNQDLQKHLNNSYIPTGDIDYSIQKAIESCKQSDPNLALTASDLLRGIAGEIIKNAPELKSPQDTLAEAINAIRAKAKEGFAQATSDRESALAEARNREESIRREFQTRKAEIEAQKSSSGGPSLAQEVLAQQKALAQEAKLKYADLFLGDLAKNLTPEQKPKVADWSIEELQQFIRENLNERDAAAVAEMEAAREVYKAQIEELNQELAALNQPKPDESLS